MHAFQATTRRELLALLSTGAAAGLAPRGTWAQATMPTRPIPATGERLPIVGLGSTRPVAAIAELGAERVAAIVRTLVEHGGRVVDTWPRGLENDAPFGRLLSAPDLRDRLFVTINIDQEGAAGIEQFERTLGAYERETIDLVNVGSLIDLAGRWPSLVEWKAQGRARYIGVTAAQAQLYGELEAFLERESPDFVGINYSVTEREAEARLLPLCADRGIATLISRPFMNGAYFERLEGTPLPDWAAELECETWAQFSLQYILANPHVTCVLTETTNPLHMAENASTASKPIPDAAARTRMRALIDAV